MGDRYTLPAGIWNSVMSVSHFSFGALGAEVAVQEVVRCRTDLAHVRAVSTTLARRGNQALLLHQAPHDLLRDVHRLIDQRGVNPPVAVAAVVALEDVGHGLAHLGVLVGDFESSPMVEVGAAWQATSQSSSVSV
jgi:hypothetical protein